MQSHEIHAFSWRAPPHSLLQCFPWLDFHLLQQIRPVWVIRLTYLRLNLNFFEKLPCENSTKEKFPDVFCQKKTNLQVPYGAMSFRDICSVSEMNQKGPKRKTVCISGLVGKIPSSDWCVYHLCPWCRSGDFLLKCFFCSSLKARQSCTPLAQFVRTLGASVRNFMAHWDCNFFSALIILSLFSFVIRVANPELGSAVQVRLVVLPVFPVLWVDTVMCSSHPECGFWSFAPLFPKLPTRGWGQISTSHASAENYKA